MTRLIPRIGRVILTLLLVVGAVVALLIVWQHYQRDPWTRDGVVQADVVQVAADASGLVTQVRVHDNQMVRRGDIMFLVDQDRNDASLAQARASVQSAFAELESAHADVYKARVTLASDRRDQNRYLSLGDLVSKEDRDQKVTAVRQDRATLAQKLAAVDEKRASLAEAQARVRTAQVNVDRSFVRAGVNGLVTGFSLKPGDYVNSGSAQFALLDIDSFYVLAYMEETKLHRFALGDRARVNLLGDSRPLWGHVDSIAAGITDRQKQPSDDSLPNINPTFSWIRLSQRVPVRIVIDRIPIGIRLVAGRTATVTILPTAQRVAPRPVPESAIVPNTSPSNRPAQPPIGQPDNAAAIP